MRFTLSTALVALAMIAEVSSTMMSPRPQHASLARRINRKKRCIARGQQGSDAPVSIAAATASSSSSAPPAASPPPAEAPPAEAPPPPPPPPPPAQPQGHTEGIVNAPPNECGFGAVPYPTQDSGPNGSAYYLTCGVRGAGWNPPRITLDNVICKPFDVVTSMPGNPFGNCAQYTDVFIAAGRETGIPSTLLASIAMIESSCREWVTGRSGEIGMMQITPDKCPGGYASDACYDRWTNVFIGARYLRGEIDRAGGNILQAMGHYNGWYVGLTEWAANDKPTCGQRNNLDYMQFVFNGYCQGVDPAALNMGTYRNVC